MLVRRVPPVPSPVLLEAYEILRSRGYEVDDGIAEEQLQRPDLLEPEHDLYVLKSHTELSLSLAGVLHAQGARMLNPYANCVADPEQVRRLPAACARPACRRRDTWVTGDSGAPGAELAADAPLLVKPYMGPPRRRHPHRARRAPSWRRLAAADDPMIVQEYIPGPGEDLKVYVVGEQVFAVRKPFSETSFAVPGRPVAGEPEVRDDRPAHAARRWAWASTGST